MSSYWTKDENLDFAVPPHKITELKLHRRDSSVGRASDWRSEGPWFNPGSRQIFKVNQGPLWALWASEMRKIGVLPLCNVFLLILQNGQNWRIRVSIPVPLECKSSALPLELIPLAKNVSWWRPDDMNIEFMRFPLVSIRDQIRLSSLVE